jgi:hypothetical protein
MLRLIPRAVLLMALLVTLVISSVPAFAERHGCTCLTLAPHGHRGGCQLNKNAQCVNTSCVGLCQ